ncbi:MAG TPA: hypothetical protein DC054_19970, partial [Blastocatellia bacterium]|nr:hypothetical protein [Blastocatellia bacterium]
KLRRREFAGDAGSWDSRYFKQRAHNMPTPKESQSFLFAPTQSLLFAPTIDPNDQYRADLKRSR